MGEALCDHPAPAIGSASERQEVGIHRKKYATGCRQAAPRGQGVHAARPLRASTDFTCITKLVFGGLPATKPNSNGLVCYSVIPLTSCYSAPIVRPSNNEGVGP